MISSAMLYAGSVVITIWGLAHLTIPTKRIVDEFGPITKDNKRILLMEWLMEGILLVFLGLLVAVVHTFSPSDEFA
ncbi:MAG: hypothetical protein OEU36_20330, partial [Gammaproteobacteria bacterium]|nr:hypothetical protein [Gammaproteobacteria bacterium]